MREAERLRIVRAREWARPERPARREVLGVVPEVEEGRPPLLFVPGFGHGAWAFAEHWLEHAASRGFPAYALSLRGHGGSAPAPEATLRSYTHDVVQVAASVPRQAVLVGHGAGALP
ncbi:alpha/beta hydrolase, partial [Micromonospora globispora]|uniref:alpha/beta hydrolase n=1 Tax=Micromonospora globispora TaxID=1450148 RepID=UPI000D936FF9